MPTPHEKRTTLNALSAALGDAETALEGADLDGLRSASERLMRALNDSVLVRWRADLSRRAEGLMPILGDELKERQVAP